MKNCANNKARLKWNLRRFFSSQLNSKLNLNLVEMRNIFPLEINIFVYCLPNARFLDDVSWKILIFDISVNLNRLFFPDYVWNMFHLCVLDSLIATTAVFPETNLHFSTYLQREKNKGRNLIYFTANTQSKRWVKM